MRIRLRIEYDGSDFAGFQLQRQGLRTVQGTLESAIRGLSGEAIRVHGAGRTDAGVHALGQVAHFDTARAIPPERWTSILNAALPPDLVGSGRADRVADSFHSRFDATRRTYRYAILNRREPSALLTRFAHHERNPLDLNAMRAAAMERWSGRMTLRRSVRRARPGLSTVRKRGADRCETMAERRVDHSARQRVFAAAGSGVRGDAFEGGAGETSSAKK